MINIGNVGAARHDANVIERLRSALKGVHGLSPDLHGEIIESCRAAGLFPMAYSNSEMHAGAANKQTRLEKLDASLASSEQSIRSTAEMLQGLLRRAGVSRDDIADGDVTKLDRVFAASRLSIDDRLVAKNLMFRLGVIA